ncbi:MAG: type II secretion system F family protein [Holosporaceae bacterium]|jgi:tight adherence protein C|nr:type II secretion system F family protein [Holosporaceae bacterium]
MDLEIFIVLLALYLIIPSLRRLITKSINDFKIVKRTGKISNSIIEISLDENNDSLGLDGSAFGTIPIFNFIATNNKQLVDDMRRRLLAAGFRRRESLEAFMASKFITGIFLFILSVIFFIKRSVETPWWSSILFSLPTAIIGGHKLTNLYLQLIANNRKAAIQLGIPDFVDLLVICFESGLNLNRSIKRIALELKSSNPILADELHVTSLELDMALDHKQVFQNLENRVECPEINTITKTFSQSIEYGSALSITLHDLATSSRQRRMLAAETKAAQVPTKLTLPMIFFTMPCLFIIMLGPVIVKLMKSLSALH